MRKICCVNDCPEVSEHKELYSLPSQYRLKQSWLAKVRDKINGHSVELNGNQVQICHLHFKLEDFALVLNIDRTITKHLDRNAIPSVFPQNAHEWDKNFISHQQLDQAHKGSSSALNDSTVASSEENAVQLGNVESLGIISSDEVGFDHFSNHS